VGEGWRMVVDGRMGANGRGARGLGVRISACGGKRVRLSMWVRRVLGACRCVMMYVSTKKLFFPLSKLNLMPKATLKVFA
jgi:hypothetical protein